MQFNPNGKKNYSLYYQTRHTESKERHTKKRRKKTQPTDVNKLILQNLSRQHRQIRMM